MTYISIASALKSILTTVKGAVWSKLAEVYDYDMPSPEDATGYPYACISNGEMHEEILDTVDNLATYTFLLRVIDIANDREATEANMRGLADDIMAELRKKTNLYLWGAYNILPFTLSWKWESGSSTPIRVCEITVQVQKSFSTL